MTDEGHQLQSGWEHSGISLWGHGYPEPRNKIKVTEILESANPAVCIIQDRREWDRRRASCFVKSANFKKTRFLRGVDDLFRVTVFKDSHGDPEWTFGVHRQLAIHSWLIYYHPDIVCHFGSWVRPEHCIRIYHSIDSDHVPAYSTSGRLGTLLSGAVNRPVYPLRWLLRSFYRKNNKRDRLLKNVVLRHHPGYNARGSHTRQFLHDLSKFKVSICTTSIYGYALRKIFESVACGCVPVTDLPIDDVLPEIDDALVRVPSDIRPADFFELCRQLENGYDADKAEHFARKAIEYYDWRVSGRRQCEAIEKLRKDY